MIDKNQTCGAGQDSVPYMTCLIHILEEWLGVEQLEDYLNFANYLLWVFTPLILLILPYFTIFLLYLTIIFLHIYKRKNVLKEAYSYNLWDGARKTVATLWDGHAAVWHGLFRWLYEKFRYPFAPMYGGFPVKLRTYLGDPIPYDPKVTAEELTEKTKNALQALIDEHQRIPGNIMSALLERFHRKQKVN
ncbi:transmembrane protein 68 isoform X4 [Lemur catta]|uniref:transmembrane protein 68 isoform X4 n=1 Tax=Lemur catta TaxID=9447 RepID=UPI001E26A691|nr:transmembrane protein 68 isoform X4 [Lemur catta]